MVGSRRRILIPRSRTGLVQAWHAGGRGRQERALLGVWPATCGGIRGRQAQVRIEPTRRRLVAALATGPLGMTGLARLAGFQGVAPPRPLPPNPLRRFSPEPPS